MSDEKKTKERSLVCSSCPLFLALLSCVLVVKCWQVSKFSYPMKILADMHQWITICSCDQSITHELSLFVTEMRHATQQCIAKNFMRRKNLLIKCIHKFCNWPCRNIYDGVTCSFSYYMCSVTHEHINFNGRNHYYATEHITWPESWCSML